MGDLTTLKNRLASLRKLQQKHPLLFAHIADCHLKMGKFGAANRVLKKGTANYPEYPAGWVVSGEYFLLHNQPDKARDSFKRVIDLDPLNSYAHERCSEIAADYNDHDDYRIHIRAMSKLDPLNDNIQKMRQADDLRQIAVNNGIFTIEAAEELLPGALRQALLEHNLLPGDIRHSTERELTSVHFEDFDFDENSEDEDDMSYEFGSDSKQVSSSETEPASEEVITEEIADIDYIPSESELEMPEQMDDVDQMVNEEQAEVDSTDWFDDPPKEPESTDQAMQEDLPIESSVESDLTDWAPEEASEDAEESATGVDWAQSEETEDPDVQSTIPDADLIMDTGFELGDEVVDDIQSEEELNESIAEEISSPVASRSEEDEASTLGDGKPKTFAEFQAQQQYADEGDEQVPQSEESPAVVSESEPTEEPQSEELELEAIAEVSEEAEQSDPVVSEESIDKDKAQAIEDDDQPAKPVFDIQSLGINEDITDDFDDIFQDDDTEEELSAIPSEEMDGISIAIEKDDDMVEESAESMDSADTLDLGESVEGDIVADEPDSSKEDEYSEEADSDHDQVTLEESEPSDSTAEIPVLAGLEGLSSNIEIDDDPESTTESMEVSESHPEVTSDALPEELDSVASSQPQIESAMSQVIGADIPEETVIEDIKSQEVTSPEPKVEPESPDQSAKADEKIIKQLKDIAAEVTGVQPKESKPIAPSKSKPIAPVAAKPGQKKPKRIATKTLAELYASQGDWHHAISVYEELLGRHPDNDAYKQRLADLQAKLG